MRRLLLGLVLVGALATAAHAQTAPPEPIPTPQPAPPPVVNVTPQVNVDMPGDESTECSWRKPSTWWGCLTSSAKKQVQDNSQRTTTEWWQKFFTFLRTPNPFANDRVRELWTNVSVPLCLAMTSVLLAWGLRQKVLGELPEATTGDLIGRAGIALTAAAVSIIAIPWLIGMSNEAAQHLAFTSFDPSRLPHGNGLGAYGVLDFIALIVLAILMIPLLILGLLRWVIFTIWCVVSPEAGATYTYPGSEDFALTYVKGVGAMLGAPLINAFILAVSTWILMTGHDIFPVSWGAWLDFLLMIVLALLCLIVELWWVKVAFGIHNFSGLKRAMRRSQHQTIVALQGSTARGADLWEAQARGRIGL